MTSPNQYLIRMLVFLVAVGVVVFLLFASLERAFDANPLLNALILTVLAIGILWNLRAAQRLGREVTWVETFQQARQRLAGLPQPRLLAPMARMLNSRAGDDRFTLSAPAQRSLLDSVASRLDEQRELSRYMVGLLIFLGLLGTFWGLLLTVSSISQVIAGMSVGSGDVNALFEQLKTGLAKPLQGMGTAFSSSMLGLSSALVLGFLDLTAGQAQNRFFNEMEEWLAGLTHLGSGVLGGDADGSVPAYLQALLEQTAENMQQLQAILARGEDGRRESNHAVLMLSERLGVLNDMMHRDGEDAARGHLRNIDLHLQRLITDLDAGRMQATAEIRNEIRILAKTIASTAEDRRG